MDDKVYRLTIDDALKLQGFENYTLVGKNTDKWKNHRKRKKYVKKRGKA